MTNQSDAFIDPSNSPSFGGTGPNSSIKMVSYTYTKSGVDYRNWNLKTLEGTNSVSIEPSAKPRPKSMRYPLRQALIDPNGGYYELIDADSVASGNKEVSHQLGNPLRLTITNQRAAI